MKDLSFKLMPTIYLFFGILLMLLGSLAIVRIADDAIYLSEKIFMMIIFIIILLAGLFMVLKYIHRNILQKIILGTPLAKFAAGVILILYVIFIKTVA